MKYSISTTDVRESKWIFHSGNDSVRRTDCQITLLESIKYFKKSAHFSEAKRILLHGYSVRTLCLGQINLSDQGNISQNEQIKKSQ
jgi:hypothetical protein